jgi:hypothetical protein
VSDSRLRTDGSELRTDGGELRTDGGEVRTVDAPTIVSDSRLRTDGGELRTDGGELRTDGGELRTDSGGLRTHGCGLRRGRWSPRTGGSRERRVKGRVSVSTRGRRMASASAIRAQEDGNSSARYSRGVSDLIRPLTAMSGEEQIANTRSSPLARRERCVR